MDFEESGFLITAPLFSSEECDVLAARLNATPRSRAGARHLLADPLVSATARDERMLRLARRATGTAAVPYRATLFEKSSETNWLVPWHQDTALPLAGQFQASGWGPWSNKEGILYAHAPAWALSRVVALRLHLDDSLSENGPLRVVPGSHRAGVLSDGGVLEYTRLHESAECPVLRGAVLAMRPLLIHASSKATKCSPRRVLHFEYAGSMDLAGGIRLAVA